MSANIAKEQSLIEETFLSAIKKLTDDESGDFINDLFVQADAESGELQIYDENDNLLEKVVIFDWVNNSDEEDVFNKKVAAAVKASLNNLVTQKVFDNPRFMRPLSISLTDEDFVVIEELLFLDDDMLRLDDPLLKNLDADLNDFLKKLLSDVK
jgi:hypothetical protein